MAIWNNLKDGENALGVILGTGWQNVHTIAVWYFEKAPWRAAPRLLMDLRIEYTDGKTETINIEHRPNPSSGGKPSLTTLQNFLAHPLGPQYDALIQMIRMLIHNSWDHPN